MIPEGNKFLGRANGICGKKLRRCDCRVDVLVRAQVARTEIQMLAKLVEGLGHLGVVTTINKETGEVLIQTTRDCWPNLQSALRHMPLAIEFLVEECRL